LRLENPQSEYKGSIRLVENCEEICGPSEILVEVSNQSNRVWSSDGPHPINISYHWLDEDWNMVVFNGWRTPLPEGGIEPATSAQVRVKINPPPRNGNHRLSLSLVEEGVRWFNRHEAFSSKILELEVDQAIISLNCYLRVLFFLEPVVYNEPGFLSCHLFWVEMFARAVKASNGVFALAANAEVISTWKSQYSHIGNTKTFILDSIKPLEPFGGDRKKYSRSLYEDPCVNNPLIEELADLRKTFDPNFIIYTSQNNYAKKTFANIACINIEQSPLPRLGHPMRTSFDPLGHQTDSFLERFSKEIKCHEISEDNKDEILCLVEQIKNNLAIICSDYVEIAALIHCLKSKYKVAVLATQPMEWVTCEGAFDAIDLPELLIRWAEDLPEGWIGIPTYHAGYSLSEEDEQEIEKKTKRIKFLPHNLSINKTEAILLHADGLITLSSTSAMTALLFQKKVVVTGISPLACWGVASAQNIDSAPVLSESEIAATLAFLTSEYSWRVDELQNNLNIILDIIYKTIKNINPSPQIGFSEKLRIHRTNLFNISTSKVEIKERHGIGKTSDATILCVNIGVKYPMEYVSILRDMVRRNLQDCNASFACITDRPGELPEGVLSITPDPDLPGWWQKLKLFDPSLGLDGRLVYFDLDVCITSTLNRLINTSGIIKDWHYNAYNSSVMVWNAGDHAEIWRRFNKKYIDKKPLNYDSPIWTDQDWMTLVGGWSTFPENWCCSYKGHAFKSPPNDCMVVCFHGEPKPHELKTGWVPDIWLKNHM
jgi:hypothetical protein